MTSNDEVGELARAFNRMTKELAETDRLRRDLVANVSHELRTPLGALQAVLENVVDGVSEADPETLRTMLAQTRRLGRLVTQLLDLSRLESGEQPFDIRPFAIADLMEGAAREARLHAPEDVVFSIDAPDGAARQRRRRAHPPGRREPRRERGALLAAAGPRGAARDRRRRRRSCSRSTTRARASPTADLERVFERFYRGDGRERVAEGADRGGAGLGLAIARWIVDLHGGTIRAERREPHGSHMVVTLPRARA